jgi:hypothetical protein
MPDRGMLTRGSGGGEALALGNDTRYPRLSLLKQL